LDDFSHILLGSASANYKNPNTDKLVAIVVALQAASDIVVADAATVAEVTFTRGSLVAARLAAGEATTACSAARILESGGAVSDSPAETATPQSTGALVEAARGGSKQVA
jgi:hypothetical protein